MVAIDSTAILHPDIQQRLRHASEIVDLLANCLQAVCASQSVPLLAVILGGDLAQAFCATAAIDALAVQESLLQGGAVCKVVGSTVFHDISILLRSGGFGEVNSLLALQS